MTDKTPLSNNFGAPLPNNEHSLTAGDRGPVLLQDYFLVEKLAHFDRERIPERVVHAKGAGAFGYFECTADLSNYTKAHLFGAIGRKTKVLVRFSTVGGEKGSSDVDRDPRGFAIKFYTEEGNYDLVGNNTPYVIHSNFRIWCTRTSEIPNRTSRIACSKTKRGHGSLPTSQVTCQVSIRIFNGGRSSIF